MKPKVYKSRVLKRLISGLLALALYSCGTPLLLHAQYVTLTGTLQGANGLPTSNYVINFSPSQFGFISGTAVIVNTTTSCATSTDGSVVGLPNPLEGPQVTTGFTGPLPPANYYVKIAFYDAGGNITLVSPETVIQLLSTGRLIVALPASGLPAGASGMKVYISTSTNAETLQGQTTGSAAFIQASPLTSGAAVPSSNTTVCKQVANDAIWPSGTGYTVSLTDPSGNTLPGYPMQWQLMGPNTTINLSNGLPYYHGTVYFPTPILASPLNHNLQSISGPLAFGGYNVLGVGRLGVGTTTPGWPIDVETGEVNASGGFIFNGGAGVSTGNCLLADSDAFHTFRVPANCLTSLGTIYYQTVDAVGTPLTQRTTLNFSNNFATTDSASPARTNVELSTMDSLTPGAYTAANITVDAWGRITLAANGTAVVNATLTNPAVVLGTIYQNTSGHAQTISVSGIIAGGGSGDSTLTIAIGPTSPPTGFSIPNTIEGLVGGEAVTTTFVVPNAYYWSATGTNHITTATAVVATF